MVRPDDCAPGPGAVTAALLAAGPSASHDPKRRRRSAIDQRDRRIPAAIVSTERAVHDHPIHDHEAVVVRRAIEDDAGALAGLVALLAAHHGDHATTDETILRTDLFASPPWATALVAERERRLVGYALLVRLYRAQYAARAMDLHHLFVAPEARRSGIGRALIQAARAEAEAQGCVRLMVGTHPDNHRAQALYRNLGFSDRPPGGPQFELRLDAPRLDQAGPA